MNYTVLIFVARWSHNFRKIAVKIWRKSKKSAEKFVHTTSYRYLRELKKILPQ